MQLDDIGRLFRRHGLAPVADALVALAVPTIWAHTTPAEEGAVPVGASKLGGRPDLPAGVAWPAWHEAMAFLGQFNAPTALKGGEGKPIDVGGNPAQPVGGHGAFPGDRRWPGTLP